MSNDKSISPRLHEDKMVKNPTDGSRDSVGKNPLSSVNEPSVLGNDPQFAFAPLATSLVNRFLAMEEELREVEINLNDTINAYNALRLTMVELEKELHGLEGLFLPREQHQLTPPSEDSTTTTRESTPTQPHGEVISPKLQEPTPPLLTSNPEIADQPLAHSTIRRVQNPQRELASGVTELDIGHETVPLIGIINREVIEPLNCPYVFAAYAKATRPAFALPLGHAIIAAETTITSNCVRPNSPMWWKLRIRRNHRRPARVSPLLPNHNR
jgi:hypothetical protein